MIHYHGTPIGGSRQDVARFLLGRHALVPFLRQDDMGAVAECCKTVVGETIEAIKRLNKSGQPWELTTQAHKWWGVR